MNTVLHLPAIQAKSNKISTFLYLHNFDFLWHPTTTIDLTACFNFSIFNNFPLKKYFSYLAHLLSLFHSKPPFCFRILSFIFVIFCYSPIKLVVVQTNVPPLPSKVSGIKYTLNNYLLCKYILSIQLLSDIIWESYTIPIKFF